jgi:hypothetical protein
MRLGPPELLMAPVLPMSLVLPALMVSLVSLVSSGTTLFVVVAP